MTSKSPKKAADDGGALTALFMALGGAAIIIGGYAAFAILGPDGPAVDGMDAGNAQLVARGETLYAETCAACHGANLEGQTADWRKANEDGTLPAPPHDESGHSWHHGDQMLFDYTKKGGQAVAPSGFVSNMPGFAETLSDEEIWAVLSFIKSRWSAQIRGRQERRN